LFGTAHTSNSRASIFSRGQWNVSPLLKRITGKPTSETRIVVRTLAADWASGPIWPGMATIFCLVEFFDPFETYCW
jgi:hypothetical protein